MLGFVPEVKYWELLSSVDIVMDLTTREACLVCGAYEAVALEKPLILSNTSTQKKYFNRGCVFVFPISDSIGKGIIETVKNIDTLKKEIITLKKYLNADWENRRKELQKEINKM